MRNHFLVSSQPLNRASTSLWAGVLVLSALSGACRTPLSGTGSFEMLEPVAPPPPKSDAKGTVSDTDVVINQIPPSVIGDLAKPVYPADALAAKAGECVVYATIIIDSTGTVSEVRPSWQRMNIPGRFSDQFFEAIRKAVSRWKFEPARNEYYQKHPDGYLTYVSTEMIAAQTDIKFTFEESGKVR
jgi:hypothetical protein